MATVGNQRKTSPSLPPRRGQIKEQIYENIVDVMVCAATKAGEVLGIKRNEAGGSGGGGGGGGGGDGGGGGGWAATSAYPSDGYAPIIKM